MHRDSQEEDKKKSRSIWDRDLVSMEREERLEMCRNWQERKSSRSKSKERKAMSDCDFDLRRRVQIEEMYYNSQEKARSRSRSRERKETCHFDLDVIQRAHQLEGNVHLRKHANPSKITLASAERSSCNLEFKCASSKKTSRIPKKVLIENRMSHEKEIRQCTPSLLARLMGLDTLPSVVPKQKKVRGVSSWKTSSVGLHEKHTANEGYPLSVCNSEYHESKDVYEVMEMPLVQKQFVDAAHVSTDDEFQYYEEHDHALEFPDPSKDIFVKILQEPNSLLKMHLQDLEGSPPSPHSSYITILKPSIFAKSGKELCYNSERNSEKHSRSLKGNRSSGRKPVCKIVGHAVKENISLPHKFSEPLYAGKTKVHHRPAQIVVLKPNLDKGWNMGTAVQIARSPENYHYDLKRQKRIPMSRRSEVFAGRRDRHKLPENMETMDHKEKGLRKIARDITKKLRTVKGSNSKMASTLNKYEDSCNETSRGMPVTEILDMKSLEWSCKKLNDDLSTSSYYSTESSVSRESRKYLSQRWKMIHHSKWDPPVDKGSSTLGEMLVSDRDTPRNCLKSSIIHKFSCEKMARGEAPAEWDCPLGISSKEGWKVEQCRNLSWSESLPDASLLHGNRKMSKRNKVRVGDRSYLRSVSNKDPSNSLRDVSWRRRSPVQNIKHRDCNTQFYLGGEESEVSDQEIHISVELHSRTDRRHLTEVVRGVPELSNDSISGRGHKGGNLAPQCKVANFPLITDDQQVWQSTKMAMPVNAGEVSANPNHVAGKGTLGDDPQGNSVSSHCNIPESASPVSSKEDRPSPVSILELPPEDDRSSSECFEKISAHLKELRMQLRLLKLESADTDDDDLELTISSDEDIEGVHCSPLNSESILRAFIDDEDRDLSYLLDVLNDSGIQPVDREVFGKLEKKYNALSSWSRSDRMLLFDLVTCTVADIAAVESRSPCPTVPRETLVDKVWFLIAKQREELSCKRKSSSLTLEQEWLDLGNDMDIIGKEVERMLSDDLVEELADFLLNMDWTWKW